MSGILDKTTDKQSEAIWCKFFYGSKNQVVLVDSFVEFEKILEIAGQICEVKKPHENLKIHYVSGEKKVIKGQDDLEQAIVMYEERKLAFLNLFCSTITSTISTTTTTTSSSSKSSNNYNNDTNPNISINHSTISNRNQPSDLILPSLKISKEDVITNNIVNKDIKTKIETKKVSNKITTKTVDNPIDQEIPIGKKIKKTPHKPSAAYGPKLDPIEEAGLGGVTNFPNNYNSNPPKNDSIIDSYRQFYDKNQYIFDPHKNPTLIEKMPNSVVPAINLNYNNRTLNANRSNYSYASNTSNHHYPFGPARSDHSAPTLSYQSESNSKTLNTFPHATVPYSNPSLYNYTNYSNNHLKQHSFEQNPNLYHVNSYLQIFERKMQIVESFRQRYQDHVLQRYMRESGFEQPQPVISHQESKSLAPPQPSQIAHKNVVKYHHQK